MDVIVGRTNGPPCPVAAILNYMAKRGPEPGPLFQFVDSWPLTWPRLVSSLRKVLQKVGIDCSKYSGHSFQIKAATTAAALGIRDLLIKTMGRWESVALLAYQLYVCTPREQLTAVAEKLAASN